MRNVRVFFEKKDECKYISHLDLNRVMLRAVIKSGIDVWRTEGFNSHPYITFALPLSLGFSSERESMDFRLLDDEAELSEIPPKLNSCLPDGVRVISCALAKDSPADIASALYEISLMSDDISEKELLSQVEELFSLPEIITEKKTKKGMKQIDLSEYILYRKIAPGENKVNVSLKLPAGSSTNINPVLFISVLEKRTGFDIYYDISRKEIYTKEGEPFE